MRARHKISRAGIELIKSFEGLRQQAMRLPDGRWTLGYGHTFSAREGAHVTPEDADALLRFDLLPIVDLVNNLVLVPLNQNQFDALVSFCFNIGTESFVESDVLTCLNAGRAGDAAMAMDGWRSAEFNGQTYVLAPLIRRRAAEKDMFLTPEGHVQEPGLLARPLEEVSTLQQEIMPAEGGLVSSVQDSDEAQPEPVIPELVTPEPIPDESAQQIMQAQADAALLRLNAAYGGAALGQSIGQPGFSPDFTSDQAFTGSQVFTGSLKDSDAYISMSTEEVAEAAPFELSARAESLQTSPDSAPPVPVYEVSEPPVVPEPVQPHAPPYLDETPVAAGTNERIAVSSEAPHQAQPKGWQIVIQTASLVLVTGIGLGCLGFATGARWQATHDQTVIRAGFVDTYTGISILTAAIGILFISISVWMILKRLGGLKD
ncbi:MAG: lysozyme [Asticcacaulis sp.]